MLSLSSVWKSNSILNFFLYYLPCVKIETKTAAYESAEEALCLCVFNDNNLDLNEWHPVSACM